MVGILETFEERLSKLEETILPLYSQTEILQLRQKSELLLYFVPLKNGRMFHVVLIFQYCRHRENGIGSRSRDRIL
mgnify:CR=1 FL=1